MHYRAGFTHHTGEKKRGFWNNWQRVLIVGDSALTLVAQGTRSELNVFTSKRNHRRTTKPGQSGMDQFTLHLVIRVLINELKDFGVCGKIEMNGRPFLRQTGLT